MKEHNPQNKSPEEYDWIMGFRLLTEQEVEFLSDEKTAASPMGRTLLNKLWPQFWSNSACRWVSFDVTQSRPLMAQGLTYRTECPPLPETFPVQMPTPQFLESACEDFVESFNFLSTFHHEIMLEKGFWEGETAVDSFLRDAGRNDLADIVQAAFDGQKIALEASELSEALEGIRHGNEPDDKVPEFNSAEAEFADVILRLMDHAHKRGWNIAAALVAKMKMNAIRASMHGGKKF